jgi:hypothetical protein
LIFPAIPKEIGVEEQVSLPTRRVVPVLFARAAGAVPKSICNGMARSDTQEYEGIAT